MLSASIIGTTEVLAPSQMAGIALVTEGRLRLCRRKYTLGFSNNVEAIEAKIAEWQAALEQLQAQRQQIAQQMTDVDISIQRNMGAIVGTRELLQALVPAAETAAQDQ